MLVLLLLPTRAALNCGTGTQAVVDAGRGGEDVARFSLPRTQRRRPGDA